MLKRLLIAVLALSFVLAFTGTAFSDVYPDFTTGEELLKFDASNPKASQLETARPIQTASKPASNLIEVQLDANFVAGPPLAGFCLDQELFYHDGFVFVWTIVPGNIGDDLYNTRYTSDINFNDTLKIMWQHIAGVTGTPGIMAYLWEDDGFGFPLQPAIDSIFKPTGTFGGGWNLFDFEASPNAPAGGWVFSDGEQYHYGFRAVGVPGDEIDFYTDQGLEPNNGHISSAYDNNAASWGTLFSWYGLDLDLLQSSEYCAGEIPFSDCFSLDYFNILWFTWKTPDPTWGNQFYSQRFDAAGPSDTLTSVDVYIFESSDLSFGGSDVVVNIYDDDGAGAPGPTLLFSATLLDGSYVPGWNTIPVNMIMTGNYHVALTSENPVAGKFLSDGVTPDTYEKFVSDDGLNPTGRGFTSYDGGATWTPMIIDWGVDVNFAITANVCRDPFEICNTQSAYGNVWFQWTVTSTIQQQAIGVRMTAVGANCQVNEVSFGLNGSADPLVYTEDSKISVYTDAGGVPGTEIASILVPVADYAFWPALQTVDFHNLDVFVTGDYHVVIEALNGGIIKTLSDDGGFDNSARSSLDLAPVGAPWLTMLDAFGTDYGWVAYSSHCCIPFDERACMPGSDAGWSTFQGSQARTGASMLSVGDAWCNMNLNWSYDGPNAVSFTGPVISGDFAVCSFSDSYTVFDIITGAIVYTLDGLAGDGQLLGSGIRCAPSIVGGVMYVSGGNTNGIGAIDFATGAVLWQRTFFTVGGGGLFGQTRFSVMTILNDGVDDILYFTTDNGAIAAVYAATGNLYTGWTVNPVMLSGSPYVSGATDGSNLFYSTQQSGSLGDIYSINSLTGVINWDLSSNGGLQAEALAGGPLSFFEGFRGGVALDAGVLYAVSWANDLGTNDHPTDGVFYAVDAGSGNLVVPAVATNRSIYSTPVVNQNAVYAPTLSQWGNPTDVTGGNLIAFSKSTGTQLWGAKTADDGRYYSSGILSCEPSVSDLLFIFNDNGFLECYNEDGDQIYRRRVDHPGGSEIGFAGAMAMTATDGLHMMFADFWGGLYDFKPGVDRPRLEIQSYTPAVAVEFGGNPALPVNAGGIIVNTGCTDLNISSTTVDELPISGASFPAFVADVVTEDIMERAAAIGDFMKRDAFLSKFRQIDDNLFNTQDESFAVKSFDNEKTTSRYAAGIPAWFVSLDAPIAGSIIPAGDTADLLFTVNQPLITRGSQIVYINWGSDDPDFFLNAAADAAGFLPEIRLNVVGGCLTDTTELNFGVGSANIQLVTNTGRIGTGDWTPHGFEIDGDNSSYYQGTMIYANSKFALAMNTQDWSSGGGEVDAWTSMQADPNFCDNSCKPALTASVAVGSISTDGLTYDPIDADMVCKTYIDSVENFDTNPDPLVTSWAWNEFSIKTFDDTLSMGLNTNARVIGVSDLPALANLTLEIFDINERNGNNVDDWFIGQLTDYDVGGDDATWDQSISTAWAFNPGGDGAWGSTKIPFGCGTILAGQDFDYVPIRSIKGMDGNSALFTDDLYHDSAYMYLSAPFGTQLPTHPQNADFEMHTTYAAHNFGPNGTFSMGIANFGVTGLADNTSGAELADMANLVNKWAGFGRGDVNNDGGINLADIIYLAGTVNNAGPGAIPFAHLGDVNADGAIDAGDITYLVNYYFSCGPCPSGDWMF